MDKLIPRFASLITHRGGNRFEVSADGCKIAEVEGKPGGPPGFSGNWFHAELPHAQLVGVTVVVYWRADPYIQT